MRVGAHGYFVDTGAHGAPTLYRRELGATGGDASVDDEELVQGVENIQILYGLDVSGDGFANRYIDADDVPSVDWDDVVTVRVHILFRSFAEVTQSPQTFRFVGTDYTPADRFLRQEFISTIELRNKG